MRGFAEPCGSWQLPQPSKRTTACSKVNGPRLSPWHWKQPGSLPAKALRQRRAPAAVWIVAIDAAHRSLRQLVVIRFLKLRPDVHMARRAHCSLIGPAFRATRPVGPLAWILWQETQETSFFTWLL